ncbi:MAG: filamentous hemagglutinin N-terminal domain-containing protein [Gammaproteobacteria bacterium]|nr:filamentous hemagglutinin N-terminal domain-containing protein [Gammaproteobacteria bacterium]
MHGSLKITRRRGGQVLSFVTGLIASVGASANPVGPTVVNGSVAFANPNPRTLEITNSPSAIINWQSFDIGARETTRFIQQNAASTVLNRVTTGNSSEILGNLVSNGRVFLINPAGILIGREGSVDTAGVLLSTLQIDDQDFLQGKLAFNAEPGSAGIVNQGYIKTAPGGEVVLIAPRIENGANGVIESPNGDLVLAAGSSITIASLDDPDITFDVRAPDNEVINLGQLLAKGGTASILAGTIRHSGEINADSLGRDANGRIVLKASKRVELAAGSSVHANGNRDTDGGSIEVDARNAQGDAQVDALGQVRANGASGGRVTLRGDSVLVDGDIAAAGATTGGAIVVKSNDATIATVNADLNASGGEGAGGRVLVDGGDSVFSSATMRANGQRGGTVRVLGDDVALAAANISVAGENGGGKVRIGGGFQGGEGLPGSNKTTINDTTRINADATVKGNGGDVVVWSDGKTAFSGTIRARGGAEGGDGGQVEVSGKKGLGYDGTVLLSAAKGEDGTLLMDPKNIRFTSATLKGLPVRLLDPHPGSGNRFAERLQFFRADGSRTNQGSESSTIVVYDELDDFGGADAGAVYVFRSSDGALVSQLHGVAAGDLVGESTLDTNDIPGVAILDSDAWGGGRGALTVFNPVTGLSGAVTAANSLVGASVGDDVGDASIDDLGSGLFVVRNPDFNGGAGSVTFATTTTLRGVVSSSNSLVGASAGEFVGNSTLRNLGGGNYAVVSPNFNSNAGAITFTNGRDARATGVIGSSNSLVGANPGDGLGSSVVNMGGGRFYSRSDNGGLGSVTFFGAGTSFTGTVDQTNSLVGSISGDDVGDSINQLGSSGIWAVQSRNWQGGVGAVTWVNAATGITGTVDSTNSLLGTAVGDLDVSFFSSFRNTTGNKFLLFSDNGGKGSVTFVDPANFGAMPRGVIDSTNSLVGAAVGDKIGFDANNAPNNFQFVPGHYAILSPQFNGGAGAITFGDFTTGVSGVVSASNSLVGAGAGAGVGATGITNAGFGLGFVRSSNNTAGAVTFINFSAVPVGVVDASNSLVGNAPGDQVGNGGINFVGGSVYAVSSPNWATLGGLTNAGAVTLVDMSTGHLMGTSSAAVGAVDASNSLVGTAAGDQVGSDGVDYMYTGASADFYGVRSSHWSDGGALTDAGAITWFTLNNPLNGAVSASNSLVGSSSGDVIGEGNVSTGGIGFSSTGVYQPFNLFQNGGQALFFSETVNSNGGAVILLDGTTPTTGPIGIASALFGGTANDQIGSGGIFVTQTHLVVMSPNFDDFSNADAGAVTIASLGGGLAGFVSSSNSLVGDTTGDRIGSGGISRPNTENQFIVFSPDWHGTTGAITYIDLDVGHLANDTDFVGAVGTSNSLVGSAPGDFVGDNGLELNMTGDKVLISSPDWNGTRGAVTYLDLNTGLFGGTGGTLAGVIDETNSLVGRTAGDAVGSAGSDMWFGNSDTFYVVFSPLADNTTASVVDAGAVTIADINSGVKGFVDDNTVSLVGTNANDRIGLGGDYQFLTGDQLLLENTQWNSNRGALTFIDLANQSNFVGDVNASNSLVGSTAGDNVGSSGITFLDNNLYAVRSPNWNNGGSIADAGAITWGNRSTGVVGVLDSSNSLFGSHVGDFVGSSPPVDRTGSIYTITTTNWDGGKSALTIFDINQGLPTGEVDTTNSLLGSTIGDNIGSGGLSFFNVNGQMSVVVRSPSWDNGAAANAGAITVSTPGTVPVGLVGAGNSLVGSTSNDVIGNGGIFTVGSGTATRLVVMSQNWDNGAAVDAGAITTFRLTNPTRGAVSSANSLVGSTSGDRVGFTFRNLSSGLMAFNAPNWNANRGAITFWNQTSNLTGTVGAGNSLLGAFAGDALNVNNFSTFSEFGNGNQILFSNFGGAGSWTFIKGTTPPTGVISAANSLVGSRAGDLIGSQLRFVSGTQYGIFSPGWDNGPAVDAGAITMFNSATGNIAGTTDSLVGNISQANSLVGQFANDRVGDTSRGNPFSMFTVGETIYGGIFTQNWNSNRGAITWFTPGQALTGTISKTNSLVGTFADDQVGGEGAGFFGSLRRFNQGTTAEFWALFTPTWNSGRGAVTWLKPGERLVGEITANNSLVGANPDDFVGGDFSDGFSPGLFQLTTGNFMLWSREFGNEAGAVTFIDMTLPLPTGVVAAGNSFVGNAGDRLGSGGIEILSGDRILLQSPNATVDGFAEAGRLDIFDGSLEQSFDGFDTGAILTDELAISIPSVVKFLNAGGKLALQASNDVFIPEGTGFGDVKGGSLTLQAGRNIEIKGIIKTDGFLRLHANAAVGDPALREEGEGFVNLLAGDGLPAYVVARELEVEAENVVVQGGTGNGAFAGLIGIERLDIFAHGSGAVHLKAGTGTPLDPTLSLDLISRLLSGGANVVSGDNSDAVFAPIAVIASLESVNIVAQESIELVGGGSTGAFASIASFGELKLDTPSLVMRVGSADNTDAVILGLGGVADVLVGACEGCTDLLADPIFDVTSQTGIFRSGLFANPTTDQILAMLGGNDQKDANASEDEDDDEEGEAAVDCD